MPSSQANNECTQSLVSSEERGTEDWLETVRHFTILFLLPVFFLNSANDVLPAVLPLYCLNNLKVSATTTGGLVSLQHLAQAGISLPAGRLIARLTYYQGFCLGGSLLLMGTFGYVSGFFIACPETGTWMLALSRLLWGLGQAFWTLSRMVFFASLCPVNARGRISSLSAGMNRWGSFLSILLGGIAAEYYNYAAAFVLQGSFIVIALLVITLGRAFSNQCAAPINARRRVSPSVSEVYRRYGHTLRVLWIFAASLSGLRTAWKLLLPLQLRANGFGKASTAACAAFAQIIECLVFPLGGYMSDTHGRMTVGVSAMLLLCISFATIPLATTYRSLLVGTVPYAIGNGISTGLLMALGADVAPPEARLEFLSLWKLFICSGQLAGPLAAGAFIDFASLRFAGIACAALAVCTATWLRLCHSIAQRPSCAIPASRL